MKLRSILPMLAVATFTLSACASKVSFADFQKKANEAMEKAKDVSFSKVVVDGYISSEGSKTEFDKVEIKFEKGSYTTDASLLSKESICALAMNFTFVSLAAIEEDEDCTYYAGGSFKVVDKDKNQMEWNQYGLLTSMKTEDSKLTVKYSK